MRLAFIVMAHAWGRFPDRIVVRRFVGVATETGCHVTLTMPFCSLHEMSSTVLCTVMSSLTLRCEGDADEPTNNNVAGKAPLASSMASASLMKRRTHVLILRQLGGGHNPLSLLCVAHESICECML